LNYNAFTQTLDINVMSTFTPNCHHKWLVKEFLRMHSSGFLSSLDFERLDIVGTSSMSLSNPTFSVLLVSKTIPSAFKSFQGPYASSVKEPDTHFEVKGQQLPSIVVESGWSESKKLRDDMKLWLVGGAGQVQLVLLLKWSKNAQGKVLGVIEMWGLDKAGNEILLQTAVSFARVSSLEKHATLFANYI
jgi:hypothetical protein